MIAGAVKNSTAPVANTYKKVGETVVRSGPKVGRNDYCPCGTGKKYKKCCMPR